MSDQDRAYYRIKDEPVTTCATCAVRDAETQQRQHIADALFVGSMVVLVGFALASAIRCFFEWRSGR